MPDKSGMPGMPEVKSLCDSEVSISLKPVVAMVYSMNINYISDCI